MSLNTDKLNALQRIAPVRSSERVRHVCLICGDEDCTGLRHCSPSDPYYEQLRDPRDKEIDRLNEIINRASVRFHFDNSTDGETAAAMLKILNEAKVPNDQADRPAHSGAQQPETL